jgi:signal transduction histidine kinase/CheY-like chemotaxis protein
MSIKGPPIARWIWGAQGPGRPLRSTLLLLALLPLIGALIALGWAMMHTARSTISASEGQKLSAQAQAIAEIIDTTIGQRLDDLRSRAALLPVLGLHERPDLLSLWIDTIQQHVPEYTWIGFADRTGTVRAANQGMLVGKNVLERDWFQQGLKRSTTIDLHEAVLLADLLGQHPSGGHWRFIDLATPVQDASGRTLGVLGAHLSWDWLLAQHKRFLTSIPKHLHAEIIVLGEDGKTRLMAPVAHAGEYADLDSVRQARAGQQGWLREQWPDGRHYLVGYVRNPGYGSRHQLGWITLISLPDEEVNSEIAPVVAGIWAALTITGLTFLAALALLLNRTLGPMERLTRDVEKISREGGSLAMSHNPPREFQLLTQVTNQMIRSLKAQQAADQNKSRFIADMSHEIRTPLNGMVGLAELMKQRAKTPQDQADLESLTRCGKELNTLLSDLIDFSAIEEGRLRFDPQPTQPRFLIEQSIALFRATAEQKGLSLRLQQGIPEHLAIRIDASRLSQILNNLISNAIKFTAQGSVELRSSLLTPLDSINPQTVELMIEVEDTGIGLTRDQQEIVFGRFQQAGTSIAQRYGGSGLGLTLARSLLAAMGGRLALRSAPGQGSCFVIHLSAVTAAEPEMKTTQSPNGSSAAVASQRRILVVDDVAMNREILIRWLSHHGAWTDSAACGEEAVAKSMATAYDCILIDIDLPGISGREAARRIRMAEGPSQRSLMIAISGHAFSEDTRASFAAGIDLHLSKPIDFHALLELIRHPQDIQRLGGRNTERS